MTQKKRRIAIATTSRADFGIYQPVLGALSQSQTIDFGLIAGGSHLMAEHGMTITQLEASLYPLWGKAPVSYRTGPLGVAQMMAQSLDSFARAYDAAKPDLVLAIGDRFEMHAAVAAASPFALPVAHIHGGEESEGAIDNMYRHSMSKMSHLHFCSTELSAQRLLQMGEAPENVHVTGAPALDGIAAMTLLTRDELSQKHNFPSEPFILATYHPETLSPESTRADFEALLAALELQGAHVVFSLANADAAGDAFNSRLTEAVAANSNFRICDSLGRIGYFSAMAHALGMVGNSSSGIIEAASFHLPVVNVGDRQKGRERSGNVIDAPADRQLILASLQAALSAPNRVAMLSVANIYGDGNASPRIVRVLETADLGPALTRKRFALRGPD
jgi:UDP-hydrolysing UDP-N-acetyl-D-glucosamine 2-epimerase